MLICCATDLHAKLDFQVPECDLLLVGGDICPTSDSFIQANYLRDRFKPWLDAQPAKCKIIVAGNHDKVFEKDKNLLPKFNAHILEDRNVTINGLKIHGSPWTKYCGKWAYTLAEWQLPRKWNAMEDNTDILLLHSPPYGISDRFYDKEGFPCNGGSVTLLNRIFQIKPQLVVFGHIHEGYGIYEANSNEVIETTHTDNVSRKVECDLSQKVKLVMNKEKIYFINASVTNPVYTLVNKPILIELIESEIEQKEKSE